jgi:transcriptional regulator with XRE-family HTH domain
MSEARNANLVAARHALITQRLRQRRDDLGLTQKQIVTRLARCGLLTTNRALSSLEHGSGLDVAKLPELAIALDCTVTYLIGLTDDPLSWQPDPPSTLPAGQVADRPAAGRSPAGRPSAGSRSAWPSQPGSAEDSASECSQSLLLGAFIPQERPGSRLRR